MGDRRDSRVGMVPWVALVGTWVAGGALGWAQGDSGGSGVGTVPAGGTGGAAGRLPGLGPAAGDTRGCPPTSGATHGCPQEKKPEVPKLSKKKLRRMNRFTVAELKQVTTLGTRPRPHPVPRVPAPCTGGVPRGTRGTPGWHPELGMAAVWDPVSLGNPAGDI